MNTKFILFCLSVIIALNLKAQDFYDINTVQTIEITFAESNWDALLDAEKAGDENYIMAQSVSINGVVLDSVGVKYKGNSTYSANQVKNPFHIELDTYKDQTYDSYSDIKLSNVANDPSFLREVLSYHILRKYMDAPLSNFANVYVNGTLLGLYSNTEAVGKKFLKSRFYSKTNTFIKCNPLDGADHTTNDIPNLKYLGQDSTDYYLAYELKSDDGWQELINLCDTLQNHMDDIEEILDVDKALWMLAFNNVLVNLDSYSGEYAQNYYLYRDDNDRFLPIMWDFNESFGRFSQTGSGSLNSTTAKAQMSHLLHASDTDYPLIKNLLDVPMYKRMYLAHMKTILLENFDNDSYYTTGQELQTVIDDDVQADKNKFFTYANFISNLSTDINSGGRPGQGSSTPGIKSLMENRCAYLLALSDFTAEEPEITDLNMSDTMPQIGDVITVKATVSEANSVYLAFRSNVERPFVKIQMFDDGNHKDGSANDGVFANDITVDDAYVQYYVYAENDDAGVFLPQAAAHNYFTLTATVSEAVVSDLVINEFMASNSSTIADQDGEFDDWVELYNNGNTSIDLEGYYLSDDADDLFQWAFPSGVSIEGGAYQTVWADKDDDQTGLHANFKLSASAESIFLVNALGEIVDEVSYVDQVTDLSFGRIPNGTGSFTSMSPTFASQNGILLTSPALIANDVSRVVVFPNPASTSVHIAVTPDLAGQELGIYSLRGELIHRSRISESQTIDISAWQAGLYIVKVDSFVAKLIVQ